MRSVWRKGTGRAFGLALALLCGAPLEAAEPQPQMAGDVQIHDPSVIEIDGRFVALGTGQQGPTHGAIRAKTSPDGVKWTEAGVIGQGPPAWAQAALGFKPSNVWAPSISRRAKTVFLYYCLSKGLPPPVRLVGQGGGLTRPSGRVRIETSPATRYRRGYGRVSPALRGGCGLKRARRLSVPQAREGLGVSPALRGGCGLKRLQGGGGGGVPRVSPALRGGCGLKHGPPGTFRRSAPPSHPPFGAGAD